MDVNSKDYIPINKFNIRQNDAETHRESCYVVHKDKHYFYGGSNHANKVFEFGCDYSERLIRKIRFDFVGGACASNNHFILLCFPNGNNRLCYKSKSPTPSKWWQWFTYVEFSYAAHDSIALSLGSTLRTIFWSKVR